MIRLATEAVVRACLPSTRSIQIARWHYNLARVFLNNHNYDAAFVHLGHALGLASTQVGYRGFPVGHLASAT